MKLSILERVTAAALVLSLASLHAEVVLAVTATAPACRMATADRAWLNAALSNWRIAETTILKLSPAPLPTIVSVDSQCTYILPQGGDPARGWVGAPHGSQVLMPDGKKLPLGPISFSSASERAGQPSYFAMSLPSVWRAAKVTSGLGLERLMDGVMLHELMHTRQFYFATPRLAGIAARHRLGDDIGDDTLQERFGANPAYVTSYRRERDLLFAAAAAPTDRETHRLAAAALVELRARRSRWFKGGTAYWSEYDDVFLTMEGLGQWLAYSWYVSPAGPQLSKALALREVRRGGKYWTQDEGLALFLTIDRLLPGWQRLAFAAKPQLAEELLAQAVASGANYDRRTFAPLIDGLTGDAGEGRQGRGGLAGTGAKVALPLAGQFPPKRADETPSAFLR